MHKLTYGETFNFNVGDEIYWTLNNVDCYMPSYYNQNYKKVISKTYSALHDTIFYQFSNIQLIKEQWWGTTWYNTQTVIKFNSSLVVTHLNDTIIVLNGTDSTHSWRTATHYLDSVNYCNKYVSSLQNHNFEHWSDTLCIEGLGWFFNASGACGGNSYAEYSEQLSGYKKGTDTCGNMPTQLKLAVDYVANCIAAREMYDAQIGDEYIFERKIEGKPTETIYRQVVALNYYNNNKSLKIDWKEKNMKAATQLDCVECMDETITTMDIANLDTCYIVNDFPFDYDIANHYKEITSAIPCNISHPQYYFNRQKTSYDTSCSINFLFSCDVYHDYYKGIGFLKKINYGRVIPIYNYQPYTCVPDTTNDRDTIETLLYVKNKFYNCGKVPSIFKTEFKNGTAHYINIMPNPVKGGDDVIAYKTNSAELSKVAFVDEVGRFYSTIQNPVCEKANSIFVIPHQFFHVGLNMIAFEFADGHREITKVVVY